MNQGNFYNKNRKFYMNTLDLEGIVRELEDNFENTGQTAITSYEEALQWYDMLLNNAGDIAANFIWPRAEEVDEKGASFNNGDVQWADRTKENMKVLTDAGYMGGMLERQYGGLNLPVTVHNTIVEMVSQGDASLMNLFGLQDIAFTIQKFGNDEQKDRVLPRFVNGEVSGAMALTEPDAGSDLQAVTLKAVEKDGKWYLDGVKRFITNGCGDIHLVLARTEEGSKGGRGLSMMLYERDEHMVIRRIESKLGIHGSPTCELQFNMAPCELVGRRKMGLIKYVMSLMNGARLATSAQALGIAQAAYEEAVKYANEREQFGKAIVHFPAVFQMLKKMEAEIDTSRVLLLNTSMSVDYQEIYEKKAEKGENVKAELKEATALANFLTPLAKFTITELANKVAYDSLQVHGGVGYMKDFPVERLYRDARITNIYEGTTQLQAVAAIGSVMSGLLEREVRKLEEMDFPVLSHKKDIVLDYLNQAVTLIGVIRDMKNKDFTDYVTNFLVETASILYRLYLYLPIAEKHPEKRELFKFYVRESESRMDYIFSHVRKLKDSYGEDINELKEDFLK
jgi:alkylation response protein AidB-like acyl-CoA dehydrogenase